jgi:hypothetical protein
MSALARSISRPGRPARRAATGSSCRCATARPGSPARMWWTLFLQPNRFQASAGWWAGSGPGGPGRQHTRVAGVAARQGAHVSTASYPQATRRTFLSTAARCIDQTTARRTRAAPSGAAR